jgi:hypothetical protein
MRKMIVPRSQPERHDQKGDAEYQRIGAEPPGQHNHDAENAAKGYRPLVSHQRRAHGIRHASRRPEPLGRAGCLAVHVVLPRVPTARSSSCARSGGRHIDDTNSSVTAATIPRRRQGALTAIKYLRIRSKAAWPITPASVVSERRK